MSAPIVTTPLQLSLARSLVSCLLEGGRRLMGGQPARQAEKHKGKEGGTEGHDTTCRERLPHLKKIRFAL